MAVNLKFETEKENTTAVYKQFYQFFLKIK